MAARSALMFLTLIFFVSVIHAFIEIVPERGAVDHFNEKYLNMAKFYVRKTKRGGIYVANLEFDLKVRFGNNLTCHLLGYQFLHNEYRRSFIEFHPKLCNMLETNPFAGIPFRNAGLACPLGPGEYKINNVSFAIPEIENAKWVVPFEKAKFRVILQLTTTNETIASGDFMIRIRNVEKKTRT